MALEPLICHKDFKITQAQTNVSFFYLNPLLQVEFRAIFEPFSYILLNGSNVTQYCHVCKSQTTSGPPVYWQDNFPNDKSAMMQHILKF